MEMNLRFVVFKEGEKWLMQCLEHDLCCQATNVELLIMSMMIAIGIEDLSVQGPAPDKFFDMWERRTGDLVPRTEFPSEYRIGILL